MAKKKYSGPKNTILIVDDDPVILRVLEENVRKEGFHTITALSLDDGRRIMDEEEIDVVLLDVMFPEGSSISLCEECIGSHTAFKVIMMTASDSVDLAVEAMKLGAFDYIRKPIEFERLFITIGNALDVVKAAKEIAQLRKNLVDKYQFEKIIGDSKPMRRLFENMTHPA